MQKIQKYNIYFGLKYFFHIIGFILELKKYQIEKSYKMVKL